MIAPYLTSLQERLKPHGIQVGSYPILYKGVFVSLIGRDLSSRTLPGEKDKGKVWLAEVAQEVERETGGRIVSEEEVAAQKSRPPSPEPTVPASTEKQEAVSGNNEPPEPSKADKKAKY